MKYKNQPSKKKILLPKRKFLILLIGILVYCLIITAGTYAYLFIDSSIDDTFLGNLGEANIELTVEKIVPVSDMPLVPLLDEALNNALQGNGGVSSCIDANNNLSCEVYEIKIENNGTTDLRLTGDITLRGAYNDLKWELLKSQTERKTEYTTNGMKTAILEEGLYLEAGDIKIYYIAVWISETGDDQLADEYGNLKNYGQYSGTVTFYSSSGDGLTATFGNFDKNYCVNTGITNLGDCLLVSDNYYLDLGVSNAKGNIEGKVADFTNTAPIITYQEYVTTNVTGESIFSSNNKIKVGTGYTFDSSTGRYSLINASSMTLSEAISTDDNIYYVCNNTTNAYCNTMYIVYDVDTSTTSGGTTYYNATEVDRYTQLVQTQNISGKGLYYTTDNYGDSYYFRGKVDNNYVSFAGFIWRVVRINGDGSIRLIYSGTSTSDTGSETSIGTSVFNSDSYDAAMIGYKYGLSKTLQHTTSTNLQYSNIISTTVYYFGDSYTTNETTKKLSISGNITSGTLEEIWGSGTSSYKYTCFSTSSTGTCTTLIEISEYVSENRVKAIYHSYLSESYESTYTDENDSTIKTVIDSWYKTNIEDAGYSDYIADNIFCNDRSIITGDGFSLNSLTTYGAYSRNYTNKSPSLECSRTEDQFTVTSGETLGNGELTYPVGLLTIDEAVMAGGKYDTLNQNYYLYTGQSFWTMSPSYFATLSAGVTMWNVDSDGRLLEWNWPSSANGVRPVINLTSYTFITEGNGTATFPYKLTLDNSTLFAPTLSVPMVGLNIAFFSITYQGAYTSEFNKEKVSGYELYEIVDESYNLIDESEDLSTFISISVSEGETKKIVARVYAYNEQNEKVYSGYSNVYTLEYQEPSD